MPQFTAITTADGFTSIFIPYDDSQSIHYVVTTFDFIDYGKSTESVQHLLSLKPLPLFAVFDSNTTGLARDYVMGVLKEVDSNNGRIVALLSNDGTTKEYCSDCVTASLKGQTSTSWDKERNCWFTLGASSPGKVFAQSPNLTAWELYYWPSVNTEVLEMFPITDQDDPSGKTVWVLIRNSEPDPVTGLVTLLWATFVPDDSDQQYKEMGVLDASTYINEYALVNDNSTDYLTRRFLVSQRADYAAYGIQYNTFLTGREVTYKGGRLRQMPISTIFESPVYERSFPTIAYKVGDSVLSCFHARVLKIEAEIEVVDEGSGFRFWINPDYNDDYALYLEISGTLKRISLIRSEWFAPSATPPPDVYTEIVNPFLSPVTEPVKILVVVDFGLVEYFALDGLYAGSIFIFPHLSWDHHDFYSNVDTAVTNLKVAMYNEE